MDKLKEYSYYKRQWTVAYITVHVKKIRVETLYYYYKFMRPSLRELCKHQIYSQGLITF